RRGHASLQRERVPRRHLVLGRPRASQARPRRRRASVPGKDRRYGREVRQEVSGGRAAAKNRVTYDCLKRAQELAPPPRAEGKQPGTGLLRGTYELPAGRFHAPLTPIVIHGPEVPTWTTHYVCCCDGYAHDPLLEAPEPLERYSTTLFGREIPITAME